jgi:O-antigen ligase
MPRDSDDAIFWLTAASAAATVISIAATEILLGAAVLLWILTRRVPIRFPSYFIPLGAFFVTTLASLLLSPDPGAGRHAIQKFVLLAMGLLATAFVTTQWRAQQAYKLLLAATAVSAIVAIIQFGVSETHFLRTGLLVDDPTLVNRIKGPLGHWMTFSGVQLLVWCAAVPATVVLARKWIAAVVTSGVAIVLSNTRGVWLGAAAGFAFIAWALPRRIIVAALIALLVVGAAASPIIYRRVKMSLDPNLATNYSRAAYWSAGTQMIKDHPLFGVGPERIHDEFPRYYSGKTIDYYGHLHNNFLQIAAERGLLSLAAFIWFLVELYRSLLRRLTESDDDSRWLVLGSIAALTGFVVAGITEYNFGDSEVFVLLLFLVSVPFGLAAHVQEDPDRQSW